MAPTLRIILSAFFLCCLLHEVRAQNTYSHWYLLKSVVPIQPEESKPILELLRIHLPDARIVYFDKNDSFSIARNAEIDIPALVDHANANGFFLADITSGEIITVPDVPEKCSVHYQKTLWKQMQPQAYESKTAATVFLTQQEFDALPSHKKQALIDHGNYVITE